MQCLVVMRAHEGRDRSSMGLTYSLVRVSRIKIEASQIGIMVPMRKIFDDGDYGLDVEDGGRGHDMFHDDMNMYAIINDQQPVIAMITRSSP